MNSHTYIALLLLLLSGIYFSSSMSTRTYITHRIRLFTHFLFNSTEEFTQNWIGTTIPIGPDQFAVCDDDISHRFTLSSVISLHCIFDCIFLILVKSNIVSVIFFAEAHSIHIQLYCQIVRIQAKIQKTKTLFFDK